MNQESKVGNFLLGLLTEARRSDLPYTEKRTKGALEKVTVTLEGNHSGKFTKLAKEFKELKAATEELSAKTNALNAQIKEAAIDLFDAQDEVLTRVVETCSLTILIGKREPDSIEKTTKVDYEKIIKDLTALVPELTEKIEEIIEANTKIEEKVKVAKAPQLRVTVGEEQQVEEGILGTVGTALAKAGLAVLKALLKSFKVWGKSYDSRLKDLRHRIEEL